jgi:hypothetical protein
VLQTELLVTLGGCHLLDGLEACGLPVACLELVQCSRGDHIVEGILLTPREFVKSNY